MYPSVEEELYPSIEEELYPSVEEDLYPSVEEELYPSVVDEEEYDNIVVERDDKEIVNVIAKPVDNKTQQSHYNIGNPKDSNERIEVPAGTFVNVLKNVGEKSESTKPLSNNMYLMIPKNINSKTFNMADHLYSDSNGINKVNITKPIKTNIESIKLPIKTVEKLHYNVDSGLLKWNAPDDIHSTSTYEIEVHIKNNFRNYMYKKHILPSSETSLKLTPLSRVIIKINIKRGPYISKKIELPIPINREYYNEYTQIVDKDNNEIITNKCGILVIDKNKILYVIDAPGRLYPITVNNNNVIEVFGLLHIKNTRKYLGMSNSRKLIVMDKFGTPTNDIFVFRLKSSNNCGIRLKNKQKIVNPNLKILNKVEEIKKTKKLSPAELSALKLLGMSTSSKKLKTNKKDKLNVLYKSEKQLENELDTANDRLNKMQDILNKMLVQSMKSNTCDKECVDEYIIYDDEGNTIDIETQNNTFNNNSVRRENSVPDDNSVRDENKQNISKSEVENLIKGLNQTIINNQNQIDDATNRVEKIYQLMLNKMSSQTNIDERIMRRLRTNSENIIEDARTKANKEAILIKKNALESVKNLKNETLKKCKNDVTKKINDVSVERIKKDAIMELKLNNVNSILQDLKKSLSTAKEDTQNIQKHVNTYASNMCKIDKTSDKFSIEEQLRRGEQDSLKNNNQNDNNQLGDIMEIIDEEIQNLDNTINNNKNDIISSEESNINTGIDEENNINTGIDEENNINSEDDANTNGICKSAFCNNPLKINQLLPHNEEPVNKYVN